MWTEGNKEEEELKIRKYRNQRFKTGSTSLGLTK